MSDQVTPQIDQALQDKIAYLKQLVGVDNLLMNALYPGQAAKSIIEAQQFIKMIHAVVMTECEAHPDFAKVQAQAKPAAPSPNRAQRRATKSK